jgi:hypothetical protein
MGLSLLDLVGEGEVDGEVGWLFDGRPLFFGAGLSGILKLSLLLIYC